MIFNKIAAVQNKQRFFDFIEYDGSNVIRKLTSSFVFSSLGSGSNPFQHLEKSAVLQEVTFFSCSRPDAHTYESSVLKRKREVEM